MVIQVSAQRHGITHSRCSAGSDRRPRRVGHSRCGTYTQAIAAASHRPTKLELHSTTQTMKEVDEVLPGGRSSTCRARSRVASTLAAAQSVDPDRRHHTARRPRRVRHGRTRRHQLGRGLPPLDDQGQGTGGPPCPSPLRAASGMAEPEYETGAVVGLARRHHPADRRRPLFEGIEIMGSIQTLQHSFYVQRYDKTLDGSGEGLLRVDGSIAQRWRGIVGTGDQVAGVPEEVRLRHAPEVQRTAVLPRVGQRPVVPALLRRDRHHLLPARSRDGDGRRRCSSRLVDPRRFVRGLSRSVPVGA